jgi:hypothetical protein
MPQAHAELTNPDPKYWNAVVTARSEAHFEQDPEAAHRGASLLSLESAGMGDGDIFSWLSEEHNFIQFLIALYHLSPADREILLSYYVLGRSQTQMALVWRSTNVDEHQNRRRHEAAGRRPAAGQHHEEAVGRDLLRRRR